MDIMSFDKITGIYTLTDNGLDLINFFSQLHTVSFAVLFGLLTLLILLIIFKS